MHTGFAWNLFLRIDRESASTLRQQLYAEIRRAILDGVLAPGTRVPSTRALAQDLGISRTTIVEAFDQLMNEGYLEGQHGSGTYVPEVLPDDRRQIRAQSLKPSHGHPPVSARGAALASMPPLAVRIAGPPRPFRLGVPALDLFPLKLWSRLMNRKLRWATLGTFDYNHAAGLRELREAIAGRVRSARGARCSADQVIIVAGAQRGLEVLCQVLLDPGDDAWMEDPGFTGARSAFTAAGARIHPVRVDEDGIDVETLARQATGARLVYVTPSHQFPLGIPMSLSRRLALLEWATRARAWIVEDDYDSDFWFGTRAIPCLHGLDVDERVIYVGSFSKALFPSLRLGFLIVPPDLQQTFIATRRACDVHPPVLDQAVVAELITEGHFDRHIRRMRAAYTERLEALVEAADRHCRGALRLRPVRTGLHAVADLEDVDAEPLAEEAAARGVELMPLSAYFLEPHTRSTSVVLGFASATPEALNRGMERLAAAIDVVRTSRG
jgi:GntR family transcriptional regulator / MocR family aminotransferase